MFLLRKTTVRKARTPSAVGWQWLQKHTPCRRYKLSDSTIGCHEGPELGSAAKRIVSFVSEHLSWGRGGSPPPLTLVPGDPFLSPSSPRGRGGDGGGNLFFFPVSETSLSPSTPSQTLSPVRENSAALSLKNEQPITQFAACYTLPQQFNTSSALTSLRKVGYCFIRGETKTLTCCTANKWQSWGMSQ